MPGAALIGIKQHHYRDQRHTAAKSHTIRPDIMSQAEMISVKFTHPDYAHNRDHQSTVR